MSEFDREQYDIVEENETLPEGHKSGFVAVVGRPNAGKSTLLNAFLAQKIAAVTPRPQTTRIRQLGIITEPTYQIIFVDTPGVLPNPRHKLDEFMVATVNDALADADVILWIVDASTMPGPDDQWIAGQIQALGSSGSVILALNKADEVAPDNVLPHTEAYRAFAPEAPWILFSALTGAGRDELFQMLIDALPAGPRYYPADQVTETYIRDIAAEMIREQIFLQLRDEVPYGTFVKVVEYKLRDNGVTYIRANIFVERDTHKRIIIGRKGKQLQQIGREARTTIEALIGSAVYLDCWVKVAPKWRQNERALERFGFRGPDS